MLWRRLWATGQSPQCLEFPSGQRAGLAGFQSVKRQRPQSNSRQLPHLVPDAGQHSANFVIAHFIESDFENAAIADALDQSNSAGRGFESLAAARIGEPNALLQSLRLAGIEMAIDDGLIRFLNAVARMRETVGQIAVIGQQEQSAALGIQSANRINALADVARQKIDGANLRSLRRFVQ